MQSKCSTVLETVLQGQAYRALLWPLGRTCGYCRIQLLTGVHCTEDHGSGASPTYIFTFYLLFEGLDDGGSTSALRQVALVESVHCTTDHRSGAFPTCVGDSNLEYLPEISTFKNISQGASILTGPKIAPCNQFPLAFQ